MPHLLSNLVEKAYTPSIARLAPRHLVKKPALGKYIHNKLITLDHA